MIQKFMPFADWPPKPEGELRTARERAGGGRTFRVLRRPASGRIIRVIRAGSAQVAAAGPVAHGPVARGEVSPADVERRFQEIERGQQRPRSPLNNSTKSVLGRRLYFPRLIVAK